MQNFPGVRQNMLFNFASGIIDGSLWKGHLFSLRIYFQWPVRKLQFLAKMKELIQVFKHKVVWIF